MKSLNIKHPDAYPLVKQLAERTGESMTQAVLESVRQRLSRIESASPGRDLAAEMEAISKRIRSLPVLDARSTDEIL